MVAQGKSLARVGEITRWRRLAAGWKLIRATKPALTVMFTAFEVAGEPASGVTLAVIACDPGGGSIQVMP